ncbi:MAG: hypothetical protein K5917_07745 [Clostridiales bacterium]|nr:hypothetical protein [Clostridiales bacterium]
MKRINDFVENMFASFEETQSIKEEKNKVCEELKSKYSALIEQGKNEDEAFGIIVAEFGTVAQLKKKVQKSTDDLYDITEYHKFKKKFAVAISVSVALFFLSIISYLVLSDIFKMNELATCVMLVIVAIAISNIIFFGIQKNKYDKLNKSVAQPHNIIEESTHFEKKTVVFIAIMVLAVIAFIILGFGFNMWHPGWIVFPIGSLICAIIDGILKALKKK